MTDGVTGLAGEEGGWIDVSVTLRDGMVHWPDNPPVRVERVLDVNRGDVASVSKLSMGSHMDAPAHFIPEATGLDEMPLSATIGRARVIRVQDPESIKREELGPYDIREGARILFKTRNSSLPWASEPFIEDFVYVSQKAARYLAECRMRTVGIDYLSVNGFFEDGAETPQALLGARIWVIEGLDLSRVEPGEYDLVCLPLKLLRGDGAPARAILRSVRARGGESSGSTA